MILSLFQRTLNRVQFEDLRFGRDVRNCLTKVYPGDSSFCSFFHTTNNPHGPPLISFHFYLKLEGGEKLGRVCDYQHMWCLQLRPAAAVLLQINIVLCQCSASTCRSRLNKENLTQGIMSSIKALPFLFF